MGALLAFIPIKDWIYCGAIVLLLLGGFTEYKHIQHKAADAAVAAVEARDASVAIAAAKQKENDDADYANKLKALQDKENADLQVAHDTSDALTARLRQFEAHRCGVLQGSAPAAPAGAPAASSADPVATALAAIVTAAYHDLAVVGAERAERDALTGK